MNFIQTFFTAEYERIFIDMPNSTFVPQIPRSGSWRVQNRPRRYTAK